MPAVDLTAWGVVYTASGSPRLSVLLPGGCSIQGYFTSLEMATKAGSVDVGRFSIRASGPPYYEPNVPAGLAAAWLVVWDQEDGDRGLAIDTFDLAVNSYATETLAAGSFPALMEPISVERDGSRVVKASDGKLLGFVRPPKEEGKVVKRRLECKTGGHNKFYEAELSKPGPKWVVTKRWGRIGSAGQTKAEEFIHHANALATIDQIVAEKLGKGYVDVTPPDVAAPPPDDGQYWTQSDGRKIRPRDMHEQHLRNAIAMMLNKAGGTANSAAALFPRPWRMLADESVRRGLPGLVGEEVKRIADAKAAEVAKASAAKNALIQQRAAEAAAAKRAAAALDPFGDEAPRKFSL